MRWVLVAVSLVFGACLVLASFGAGVALYSSEKRTERCFSAFDNRGGAPDVQWFPPKLSCTNDRGQTEVVLNPNPVLAGLAAATLVPLLLVIGLSRRESRRR
jgi:hypothetical protein